MNLKAVCKNCLKLQKDERGRVVCICNPGWISISDHHTHYCGHGVWEVRIPFRESWATERKPWHELTDSDDIVER